MTERGKPSCTACPTPKLRTCGGCTACCVLGKGKLCEHCNPKSLQCCDIYSSRPQACRDFRCLWLDDYSLPESMRPDRIGIMFIPISIEEVEARWVAEVSRVK